MNRAFQNPVVKTVRKFLVRTLAVASVAVLVVLFVTRAASAAEGDLDTTFQGTGKIVWAIPVAGVAGVAVDASDVIHLAFTDSPGGTDRNPALVRFPDSGVFLPCVGVDADLGGTSADYAASIGFRPAAGPTPLQFYIVGSAAGPAGAPHDRSMVAAWEANCSPKYSFGNNAHSELDVAPPIFNSAAAVLWVPDAPAGLRMLHALSVQTSVVLSAVDADTGSESFHVTTDFDGGDDVLYAPVALLRQSNGKLVVAGTSKAGNGDRDVVVARFGTDLELDTTFGQQGFARFSYGALIDPGDDYATGAALLPDGSIVVGGYLDRKDGSRAVAVALLTADGQPVSTFGASGRYVFNFHDPDKGEDQLNAVAVDLAGNIVVAGSSDTGIGQSNVNIVVARLRSSGAAPLDTSFGVGGIVTVSFDAGGNLPDQAVSVVIDHAGRIVVGGRSLNSNGQLFPSALRLKSGLLRDAFESGDTSRWSTSN